MEPTASPPRTPRCTSCVSCWSENIEFAAHSIGDIGTLVSSGRDRPAVTRKHHCVRCRLALVSPVALAEVAGHGCCQSGFRLLTIRVHSVSCGAEATDFASLPLWWHAGLLIELTQHRSRSAWRHLHRPLCEVPSCLLLQPRSALGTNLACSRGLVGLRPAPSSPSEYRKHQRRSVKTHGEFEFRAHKLVARAQGSWPLQNGRHRWRSWGPHAAHLSNGLRLRSYALCRNHLQTLVLCHSSSCTPHPAPSALLPPLPGPCLGHARTPEMATGRKEAKQQSSARRYSRSKYRSPSCPGCHSRIVTGAKDQSVSVRSAQRTTGQTQKCRAGSADRARTRRTTGQ